MYKNTLKAVVTMDEDLIYILKGGPRDSYEDIFELHASFCAIFASPTRLRIMWMLGNEEKTVGELAQMLGLSLPNVSQHLRIMKAQGAVRSRRDGRSIYYRVTNPKFLAGAKLIREGLLEDLGIAASLAGQVYKVSSKSD